MSSEPPAGMRMIRRSLAEDLDLRLIPEAAGVDVDGVPETGEAFGESEDVDDLAPRVGSPEFGLA